MKEKRIPAVALLVETSTSWGSGIIRGVARYSQEFGPWSFFIEPRGRFETLSLPEGWHGDGIIARVNHPQLAKSILASGIPAINVSWFECGVEIPKVSTDEYWSGQLGAQHLIERGFASFGYCGTFDRPRYTDLIRDGFLDELNKCGKKCAVFKCTVKDSKNWGRARARLGNWLNSLPKPSAVLAWNDVNGRLVAEACRERNLRVPEEVAILTGEYDSLMNELSYPQLSTIDHLPDSIGYEAARTLAALMKGKAPPKKPILLRHAQIVTRHSTDVMAINDELLAEAIRFMRQNACKGITVSEVMKVVPMSRRVLEQQCRAILGRSPAEEIRRHRMEHAKQLLTSTLLPMPTVAKQSGFRDADAFGRRFRREVGISPSAFRKDRRK